ncbi:MAG TPA: MerR family transcriptional regulator [Clostridiaceae bacterium]|nr:MerR family transcriptional regulator [Clostridiaceae bacterium]
MEILKDRYSITELSQRLGTTDHTLRYYEKEFGLNIPKDERGRRYYTPELANIMYKIKMMRNDGLQIKAIRKILETDGIISEPPPVVNENNNTSLVVSKPYDSTRDIKRFFDDFKEQVTSSISAEVNSVKEYLFLEIKKTKLELGACVENSMRKLESKMEKHFIEVDRSLSLWRERNKRKFFRRIFDIFKK